MIFAFVKCNRCGKKMEVEDSDYGYFYGRLLCGECLSLSCGSTCEDCKLYTIDTNICYFDRGVKECNHKCDCVSVKLGTFQQY